MFKLFFATRKKFFEVNLEQKISFATRTVMPQKFDQDKKIFVMKLEIGKKVYLGHHNGLKDRIGVRDNHPKRACGLHHAITTSHRFLYGPTTHVFP